MDEVDGMSGSDRGGVQDLIQTIQKSKIPIICICNDKYNMKLRSLRNHTLELDFRWVLCVAVVLHAAMLCACALRTLLEILNAPLLSPFYPHKPTHPLSHTHTHIHRRPTKVQIAKRMSDIARTEGLVMTDATMDALIEGANSDIRLILGQMQVGRRV